MSSVVYLKVFLLVSIGSIAVVNILIPQYGDVGTVAGGVGGCRAVRVGK